MFSEVVQRLLPTLLRVPSWLIALGLLLPAASPGQTSTQSVGPTKVLPLEYAIPCIAFSPDGRLLWLDDQLWNLPSATKGGVIEDFPKLARDSSHYQMAVSSDGKRVAFHRYEEVILHEVPSGRLFGRLNLAPRNNRREMSPAIAFSHDGKELLTLRNDENLVRVWSLETLREVRVFPFAPPPEGQIGNAVPTCRLSRDGNLLLLHLATGGDKQACVLLETTTGKELKRTSIGSPEYWVNSSSASEDCQSFAYIGDDTLHLLDPKSGSSIRKMVLPNHYLFCVALSPDGRRVAAGFRSKDAKNKAEAIQVWDTATGKSLQQFTGHPDGLCNLCFSPDGSLLVSTGLDRTARLWNVAP